jgi:phosphatidylserine decarboxylase
MDLVMPFVPKRELSHWVGRAAHQPLPGPLGPLSVAAFARAYQIDLSEAELPLEAYKTIGELFTRRLRPGARPVGAWPVHPCDALITECGGIEKLQMIQAKGRAYSVPELLRSSRQSLPFEGGSYFTYYLSPTDYHRVHSPVDGRLSWSAHVPGELWPVNEWSVNAIANLFAINERVSFLLETARGRVALVMVAATNVGNIQLSFDAAISTINKQPLSERSAKERTYNPPKDVRAGEELGVFRMGSTVVMLAEKGMIPQGAFALRGKRAKLGEPLISQ